MPELVTSENRKYSRYAHTVSEAQYLIQRGLKPVVSSNVSAVGRDGDVLIVRFHGGATYGYPQSGDRYDEMLSAPSKGKFVWRELRRAGVPYYRMGAVNIADDVGDKDMMAGGFERTTEGATLLAALGLSTMVTTADIVSAGIIAGLVLAQSINQTSRQA